MLSTLFIPSILHFFKKINIPNMVEPKLFVNKKLKKNSILQNNSHEIKGPCVKRKSLDLDDLFEFSAARDRALERNACRPSTVPPSAEYVPHRVFINHIDSFNGKHLASVSICTKIFF